VVSQTRQLFVRLHEEAQLMAVLNEYHAAFADRYRRTQAALERGLVTLDTVTPHLTAQQDVSRQINDLERLVSQSRHDLNALLGLAPEVAVPLVGPAELPELDETSIEQVRRELPRRRPDLIALQRGYAAGELRYRAAVLAQWWAADCQSMMLRCSRHGGSRYGSFLYRISRAGQFSFMARLGNSGTAVRPRRTRRERLFASSRNASIRHAGAGRCQRKGDDDTCGCRHPACGPDRRGRIG
jgi:outer membrane protein TolC